VAKSKTRRTDKEWELIFKAIDEHVAKNQKLPSGTDLKTYQSFIDILPPNKRSTLRGTAGYHLISRYKTHKANLEMLESVVESEDTIDPVNSPQELLVVTDDIMVQMSHMFDSKLEPMFRLLKGEKTTDPVQEPLVEIKETLAIEEIVSKPVESIAALTEDMIRAIVRSEIEKIFGPIDVKPVTPVVPTTNILQFPETIQKVISAPPPIPFQLKAPDGPRLKIFVFGITSVQLIAVRKAVPKNVSVECSLVLNDSSKMQAKNSDFVVVGKFSSHSIYETLQGVCGNEKIAFASGGVSMIKRLVVAYVDGVVMKHYGLKYNYNG